MSSTSSSIDLSFLETSYQIGYAAHEAAELPHSAGFRAGPNWSWNQTKNGLILEFENGIPCSVSGLFGQWTIFSSGGDYSPTKRMIDFFKDRIELELLDPKTIPLDYNLPGQLYAVKRWDGREIEPIEYKTRAEYIPSETVHKIWDENFQPSHPDLSLKSRSLH